MGQLFTVRAPRFTRPNNTTAYAASQFIANSTTAGSVTLLQFDVGFTPAKLLHAKVLSSNASTKGIFLSLFQSAVTVNAGDGGGVSFSPSDCSTFIVRLQSTASIIPGGAAINTLFYTGTAADLGTAVTPALCVPVQGTIYGFLSAQGTYTPAANETFDVSLILETIN